jgi:hypothetical protein
MALAGTKSSINNSTLTLSERLTSEKRLKTMVPQNLNIDLTMKPPGHRVTH